MKNQMLVNSFLSAAILSAPSLVRSQTAPNPEVIYLLNCVNAGVSTSEFGYYADWSNSRNGQFPDNVARVFPPVPSSWDNTVTWETGTEQSPVSGTFADGDVFSVWGLDSGVQPGTQTGQGANEYHPFSCYRESDQQLFSVPLRESCTAIYSCSHQDFAGQEAVLSTISNLSETIVNITNGVDPKTVLKHFNDDLSNGVGCNGNSYDAGSGCSITFSTCRFPNSDVANAMGTYLIDFIAPNVPSTPSTYQPTQCSDLQCARVGSGRDCTCDPSLVHDTIISWPSTGDVTIWTQLQGNPQTAAIQAELTFEVSCPTGAAGCNSALCTGIATGASAVGVLNPELAPAAIFGGVLSFICLACH